MHPEQYALLTTVMENPTDDQPRLVYADWLEEHNYAEWARFIRVQCAIAAADEIIKDLYEEEQALFDAFDDERNDINIRAWAPPMLKHFGHRTDRMHTAGSKYSHIGETHRYCTWRRGFPADIQMPIMHWFEIADDIAWSATHEVDCPACDGIPHTGLRTCKGCKGHLKVLRTMPETVCPLAYVHLIGDWHGLTKLRKTTTSTRLFFNRIPTIEESVIQARGVNAYLEALSLTEWPWLKITRGFRHGQ